MQNGTRVTHPMDQGDRVFCEVPVDWDTSNHANPANGGMFSLQTGNGYGAKWMTPSNDLKNSTAIVALMDENIVSKHGTWRVAKFLVLGGKVTTTRTSHCGWRSRKRIESKRGCTKSQPRQFHPALLQ